MLTLGRSEDGISQGLSIDMSTLNKLSKPPQPPIHVGKKVGAAYEVRQFLIIAFVSVFFRL